MEGDVPTRTRGPRGQRRPGKGSKPLPQGTKTPKHQPKKTGKTPRVKTLTLFVTLPINATTPQFKMTALQSVISNKAPELDEFALPATQMTVALFPVRVPVKNVKQVVADFKEIVEPALAMLSDDSTPLRSLPINLKGVETDSDRKGITVPIEKTAAWEKLSVFGECIHTEFSDRGLISGTYKFQPFVTIFKLPSDRPGQPARKVPEDILDGVHADLGTCQLTHVNLEKLARRDGGNTLYDSLSFAEVRGPSGSDTPSVKPSPLVPVAKGAAAPTKKTDRSSSVPAVVAAHKSIKVDLKAGEDYYWCACGRSKQQPFCDGSHKGTGFTPLKFSVDEDVTKGLCQCKATKTPPFCDGSHRSVPEAKSSKPTPSKGGTTTTTTTTGNTTTASKKTAAATSARPAIVPKLALPARTDATPAEPVRSRNTPESKPEPKSTVGAPLGASPRNTGNTVVNTSMKSESTGGSLKAEDPDMMLKVGLGVAALVVVVFAGYRMLKR